MKVDWPYSEIGQKMANDQLLYFTVFSKILVWLHWGRKHLCMENYGEFMSFAKVSLLVKVSLHTVYTLLLYK